MFRDITIGQFYPVTSVINKLDPRVKLFGVVIYVAAVFIINNILGLAYIAAALAVILILSKVPLRHILKGMRFLWVLVMVAIFFNLMFSDGDIIWRWWIFHMSRQGILRAAFFAVRLVLVVIGSAMLTYTTTPTNLTAGLEKIFKPLNKIRFPGHEIAMMMSIALRFIPILAEEINKIMNAQLARGADFDSGGMIVKAKGMVPVMVPLFISAFRRASDLATAMESRCYSGGEGRTKMYPLEYHKRDYVAYAICVLFLLSSIGLRILMSHYISWGTI